MVTLTKKEVFKLNKNLKMHKVLNDVADIIVKDIKEGISKHSRDVNDRPFKRLSENTIASKKFKGSPFPNKPLYDEGKMKNVYVSKRAGNYAEISPNNRDRRKANIVHQEGSGPYTIRPKNKKILSFYTSRGRTFSKEVKHPGNKVREWFGVSPRTAKPIDTAVKEHIRKALKK